MNGDVVEVIFDIETKKLFGDDGAFEPSQLGVSVISAYRRESDGKLKEKRGEMWSFWDPEAKNTDGGVMGFEKFFEMLRGANRIIGFNSLGFDVPALVPFMADINKLPHFDILAKVKDILGHRLSLDAIAKETLSHTKIDNGLKAVKYWKSQDPESMSKLRKYCEMDVAVTRDVYDHGLFKKYLKFKDKWNEVREVVVDFSYPPKPADEPVAQMGLF